MKAFFGVILILLTLGSCGQVRKSNNAGLSQLQGILYFEKNLETYTMYFIKSPLSEFASLLEESDTVNIIALGSPGDDANNIAGFKDHLDKSVRFSESRFLVGENNYQGKYYEDTLLIYSKSGFINYVHSKKYMLAKIYKKVFFKNRTVIFALQECIPIESFSTKKMVNN